MPSLGAGLYLGSSNTFSGLDPSSISGLRGWWEGSGAYNNIRYGLVSGSSTSLLTTASPVSLGTGSISICSWAFKTNKNNQLGLVSRGDAGSVTGAYTLDSPGDYCRFMVSDGLGGGGQNAYANTTALSANLIENTWWFQLGVWDNTTKTAKLYLNNVESATFTNANCTISSTAGTFRLFNVTGNSASGAVDNRLAGSAGWSRALTATERAWLFNSGAGRTYIELGIAGTDGSNLLTNLQFWYDLDESSGNALDSHTNAMHLTRSGSFTTASPTIFSPSNNSIAKGIFNKGSGLVSGSTRPTNLEQGDPAYRPTYFTTGVNNRPTLQFNNDKLLFSKSSEWRLNTSLFMVCKYYLGTHTNYDTWASFYTSNEPGATGMINITAGGTQDSTGLGVSQPSNDRIVSSNPNTTNTFIFHYKTSSASPANITLTQYRIANGSLVLTGTTSNLTGTMDFFGIGRLIQATTFGVEGQIPEILLYNSALSADDEAKVISYLRKKYAV